MAQTKRDPEQVAQSIRELNDRVVAAGRKAGVEFLEAYEQTLKAFADSTDSLAEQSKPDWLASVVKAQATFTRDVMAAYTDAARGALER